MKEKKVLYILIAALNYLLGSTWVLSLYNDPSLITMKTRQEWIIVWGVTGLFTVQASLIAWKAYTSNPSVANGDAPTTTGPITPELIAAIQKMAAAPPGTAPPKQASPAPVIQTPGGTTGDNTTT